MEETEIRKILNGFEKRMKFINIMQSLIRTSYPDNIRRMINGNSQILTNIIIAVMVFIEEKTLGIQQSCSMSDIEEFTYSFSLLLPPEYNIDSRAMARYIVVEVLQNGGYPLKYLSYDSAENKFLQVPVRLLNEEKGKYHLTDDAFDFMFRTKEIESELDYSVTRFRMSEYMKRDNYVEAMEESRELIRRIRNMMNNMDDFIRMCRENISQIAEDRYESILKRTADLLDSEYDELTLIQNSARERRKNIQAAAESGVGSEKISEQFKALGEIIKNIQTAIEEQRGLINKKQSLSESYETILRDSFTVKDFEKLNFEKDILLPLRQNNNALGNVIYRLMDMFTVPEFEKFFSIENFYMPQNRIDETVKDTGIDITQDETAETNISDIRNQRYLKIITLLFEYMQENRNFTAGEFIDSLSDDILSEICQENALPEVLVSLYAMQCLEIEAWQNSEHIAVIPDGEFELSWCLNEISESLIQMKRIQFYSEEKEFNFSVLSGKFSLSITMSDFRIEVIP